MTDATGDTDGAGAQSGLWTDFPLFPLNTVLVPGGNLQLQIFEVRYLDMIGRCYRNGAPFGVVSLTRGHEVRTPVADATGAPTFAAETFATVGTMARIVEFTAPQAGLMVIRCAGEERFRTHNVRQLPHGLWVADVEPLPADPPMPIPEDLRSIGHALSTVLVSQASGESPLAPLMVEPPYRFDDCGWVANRWCDLLRLPVDVKQSLLQLDNPLLRLELVGDLLHRK